MKSTSNILLTDEIRSVQNFNVDFGIYWKCNNCHQAHALTWHEAFIQSAKPWGLFFSPLSPCSLLSRWGWLSLTFLYTNPFSLGWFLSVSVQMFNCFVLFVVWCYTYASLLQLTGNKEHFQQHSDVLPSWSFIILFVWTVISCVGDMIHVLIIQNVSKEWELFFC